MHITYNVLFNENERNLYRQHLNCIIYLCSFHVLKNIIDDAQKTESDADIRNRFVYAFTLLQHSTTTTEFETHYENIFNIFMIRKKTKMVLTSLKDIETALKKRFVSIF